MREIQKYDAKPQVVFNHYLPHGAAASPHVPVPLRRKRGERSQAVRQSWTAPQSDEAPRMGDRSRSMSDVRGGGGGGSVSVVDDADEVVEMSPAELARRTAEQKQQYEELKQSRQHMPEESDHAWQSSLAAWKSRRTGSSEKLLQKQSEKSANSNGNVRLYRSGDDHGGDVRDGRGGGRGGFSGNNGVNDDDNDGDDDNNDNNDDNAVYSSSRGGMSSLRRPEAARDYEEVTERREMVDSGQTKRNLFTASSQPSVALPKTSTVFKVYAEAPKPSPSPNVPVQPRISEAKPNLHASQASRKAPAAQWDSVQSLPRGFKAETVTSFSRPLEKPSGSQVESVKSYNRTVQGWKALEAQSSKAAPTTKATATTVTKATTTRATAYNSTGYNNTAFNNTASTTRKSYSSTRAWGDDDDEEEEGPWRPPPPAVPPAVPPAAPPAASPAAPPAAPLRQVASPPTPPPRKFDSSVVAVNRLSQRLPPPVMTNAPPAAAAATTTLVSPVGKTTSSVTVTLTKSSPPPSVAYQGFGVAETRSVVSEKPSRPVLPAEPAKVAPLPSVSDTQKVSSTSNGEVSGRKKNQWRNAEFFGFSEDNDDVMVDHEAERKQREEAEEEERRWQERRRLEGAVSWGASNHTASGGGSHNGGLGGGPAAGGHAGGAPSDGEDAEDVEKMKREIEEEERRWNERKRLERTSSSSSPTKPGPWSPTVVAGSAEQRSPNLLTTTVTTTDDDRRSASLPRQSSPSASSYNPYISFGRNRSVGSAGSVGSMGSSHHSPTYSYRDASQRPSSYRSSSSYGRQTLSPNYHNFSSSSGGGYGDSGARFGSGSPSYSATYSVNYGTTRSPGYGSSHGSYGGGYGGGAGYNAARSLTHSTARSPTHTTARSPGYGGTSFGGGYGGGGGSSTLGSAYSSLSGYGGTSYSPAKIAGEKKECGSCGNAIGNGAAMFIDSLNLFFHIDCFKCEVCSGSLGDARTGMDVRMLSGRLHCSACYFRKRGAGAQPATDL